MQIKKGKRFEELDALRGIAALLVVFFHFTMKRNEYNTFLKLGVAGVDLFFIISGFVIFMSLQRISNSKDFIINRVSRLYPTYWASVTLTFILIICHSIFNGNVYPQNIVVNYLGNMTMFQFYLRLPDIDGPYWTMIIEMIFYIAILSLFQLKLLKYLNIIGIALCGTIVLLTHFFYSVFIVKHLISAVPLLQFIPLFLAGTIFYKIYTEKIALLLNYCLIIICL